MHAVGRFIDRIRDVWKRKGGGLWPSVCNFLLVPDLIKSKRESERCSMKILCTYMCVIVLCVTCT